MDALVVGLGGWLVSFIIQFCFVINMSHETFIIQIRNTQVGWRKKRLCAGKLVRKLLQILVRRWELGKD